MWLFVGFNFSNKEKKNRHEYGAWPVCLVVLIKLKPDRERAEKVKWRSMSCDWLNACIHLMFILGRGMVFSRQKNFELKTKPRCQVYRFTFAAPNKLSALEFLKLNGFNYGN